MSDLTTWHSVSCGFTLEFDECGKTPVGAKEEPSLGHSLGGGLRSQGLLSGQPLPPSIFL